MASHKATPSSISVKERQNSPSFLLALRLAHIAVCHCSVITSSRPFRFLCVDLGAPILSRLRLCAILVVPGLPLFTLAQ